MKRNNNNFKLETIQASSVIPSLNCSPLKNKLSPINKGTPEKVVMLESQDNSFSFDSNSEGQISILNNFFSGDIENKEVKPILNENLDLQGERNMQVKQQPKDIQQKYVGNSDFIASQQNNSNILPKKRVGLKLNFNLQPHIRIHSHSIQIVKKNFSQQKPLLVEGSSTFNGASNIDGQNVHATQCHPFYNTLQPLSDVSHSPFGRFKIKSQSGSKDNSQKEKYNGTILDKRYAINESRLIQDLIKKQKIELKINKYDRVGREQDLINQNFPHNSVYTKLSKIDRENMLKMNQKSTQIKNKSNSYGHYQEINLRGIMVRKLDLTQPKKQQKQKITTYQLAKIKKDIEGKITVQHLLKENRLKIR